MSAGVINQNHYKHKIFRGPGEHTLTLDKFDTPFVPLVIWILVNAAAPADIKIANNLQDLMKHQVGLPDVINTFGSQGQVNKVRHSIATAYGWGGLSMELFHNSVSTSSLQYIELNVKKYLKSCC